MTPDTRSSGPAVLAVGLVKKYGELVAVDGIDLEIARGSCTAMLGPNGAGKTTTIRMIQCALPPTSGSLEVLGINALTDRRDVKRRIGVVPQEDNLDPDFTVRKNLTTYARFYGIKKDMGRRADELLAFVGLEGKRDAHTEQLSGGMKRRLIVARSLVNDPELLVLDEPTTGLDPQARHTIWDKIRTLKRQGKTVLLTTHYMDEAERLADHVIIIDHGRILEQGTPQALIKKHTGGEAVEFVIHPDATATRERLVAVLQRDQTPHEVLQERVIAYAQDSRTLVQLVHKETEPHQTILRHATLEDVFLRLTGRALRD